MFLTIYLRFYNTPHFHFRQQFIKIFYRHPTRNAIVQCAINLCKYIQPFFIQKYLYNPYFLHPK